MSMPEIIFSRIHMVKVQKIWSKRHKYKTFMIRDYKYDYWYIYILYIYISRYTPSSIIFPHIVWVMNVTVVLGLTLKCNSIIFLLSTNVFFQYRRQEKPICNYWKSYSYVHNPLGNKGVYVHVCYQNSITSFLWSITLHHSRIHQSYHIH